MEKEELSFIIKLMHKERFPELTELMDICKCFDTIFDAMPTSLPIPKNVPLEIPRIILQGSNTKNRIEFAVNQTIFVFDREMISEEKAIEIIQKVLATFGVSFYVKKVHVNSSTIYPMEKPWEFIVEKLKLNDSFPDRGHMMDLTIGQRNLLKEKEINYNEFVKISTATKNKDPFISFPSNGVMVTQDISNAILDAASVANLDKEYLRRFVNLAYTVIAKQNKMIES